MEPMQSRAHQLGALLWLAFCLACFLERSHAQAQFPFPIPIPIPLFGPSYTNQRDIDAVNELYSSLGSPDLSGWTASGGDPCKEAWQGVQCTGPNITAIGLRGAGLEGKLSEALGKLTAITRLDFSLNSLSGQLPDSMANLNSLSVLHVQSNQLTGTLDVLVDLPLKDLNVENNIFSGQIPEKLLSIPKFLRNGNHFTVPPIPGSSPTPASSSPATPSPGIPQVPTPASSSPSTPSSATPQAPQPSHPPIYVIPVAPEDVTHGGPPSRGSKVSPTKIAGFSVLAASSVSIAVLVTVLAVSRWRRERSLHVRYLGGVELNAPAGLGASAKPDKEHNTVAAEKMEKISGIYTKAVGSSAHPSLKNSSNMCSSVSDNRAQGTPEEGQSPRFSFKFYTVASLQQWTNSFSDQNLMRETRFGKIYLAEHPESKFAVLKLHDANAKSPVNEFLKTVQSISGIKHPNIEELVGCCVEHGQRLLIYKHFSELTLDDMIHTDIDADADPANNFPWHARIAVALEAAKALEHLHDGGGREHAAVHGHFRPEHVLVDAEARVRVSGCGLAPLAAPSGRLDALSYEPPEEAAGPTAMGDVYCFGVVMLQLLTGRRPYDESRPRGERHLVPWATARLHDLNALRRMADPRLVAAPVRSVSRFADIVSRCLQREAEFRPVMSQVEQDLRRALEEAGGLRAEENVVGRN